MVRDLDSKREEAVLNRSVPYWDDEIKKLVNRLIDLHGEEQAGRALLDAIVLTRAPLFEEPLNMWQFPLELFKQRLREILSFAQVRH